eukprot:COSAG02_NODE_55448_length_290_cov_1.083770_1_plen_68_part_01
MARVTGRDDKAMWPWFESYGTLVLRPQYLTHSYTYRRKLSSCLQRLLDMKFACLVTPVKRPFDWGHAR